MCEMLQRHANEAVCLSPSLPKGTDQHILDSFSAATAPVKELYASVLSLTHRTRHIQKAELAQTDDVTSRSRGGTNSSQPWKYVCTGTCGQYNMVREGSSHKVVRNKKIARVGRIPRINIELKQCQTSPVVQKRGARCSRPTDFRAFRGVRGNRRQTRLSGLRHCKSEP